MNFVKFLRTPLLQSASGYCFWPLGLADLRSVVGYLGLALVFGWGGAPRGVGSLFFGTFVLVLAKLLFWQRAWGLGYHSMGFRQFPMLSRSGTRIYHVYK